MNIRLTKYLIKKYPLCFGDYGKDLRESCMAFGIEFNGSGWYKILKEVCEKSEPIIQKWIEENKIDPHIYIYRWFTICLKSWFPVWATENILSLMLKYYLIFIFKFFPKFADRITAKHLAEWCPKFAQLKEKYGTMRVYFTSYPDGFDEIEMEAERKSETTCEKCGKPGKLRGQGWYYTSCYKHSKPEDRDNLELLENKYTEKQNKKSRRNK